MANVEIFQTVLVSGVLQFMWHYVHVVEKGVTLW